MLNDEQAADFARLIAECAGAAYGNHGADTADAYRALMEYVNDDLLAAERERVIEECAKYFDAKDGEIFNAHIVASDIRSLKGN